MEHFYSQVMNTFVEALNKKIWGKSFFSNKTKKESFLNKKLFEILRTTTKTKC